MKLTQVDRRLEGKLQELLVTHQERTAKIDWSYHELIPWERGRNYKTDPYHPSQATISPELALAVETAHLTEINLPWFTTGLTQTFAGTLECLQDFVRTWTSEEDQHSNILETYLLVTRNVDPVRFHHIRKTVVRDAWTPEWGTPFEGMAYTTIQELATQAFYVNTARKADAEDPVLANILRTIAKDETLHYTFYREAVKAHLQANPNYVWPLVDVLINFSMPGRLMPNFDERTAIIAASGNYGIADYFRQVVEVLVKVWDIKNLKPDYPQAQDAMDRLNKHLERLARLAVLAERRKTGSSATIRAQAMKLLGWDEEEALVTAGGVLLNP
jgi:acyl-[acyl-carrier-protein] desaturase